MFVSRRNEIISSTPREMFANTTMTGTVQSPLPSDPIRMQTKKRGKKRKLWYMEGEYGGGGGVTGRGVEDSENLLIAFIKAHL